MIPLAVVDRVASQHALDRRAIACCLDLLRATEQLNARLQSWLQSHDLSSSKYKILTELAARESLSPSTLAQTLGVRRPTLSGLVDNLQAQGLVTRRPDARDRRRFQVTLTDAGAALAEQAMTAQLTLMAASLGRLTLAERSALRKILSHLQLDAEEADQ